jgi:hypothetical protein
MVELYLLSCMVGLEEEAERATEDLPDPKPLARPKRTGWLVNAAGFMEKERHVLARHAARPSR